MIAPGTAVWHYAHIREGAHIGTDCTIGKNVYIDVGVDIGNGCKIENNVSVFAGVVLDAEVLVGPSATFTNDLYPRAQPVSGWEIVSTRVGEGASIGANATVVCGHAIGAWSTVAAGAVITRDVEPHELVAGNPARRLGWVCRCGYVLSHQDDAPDGVRCGHCGRNHGTDP